jgi:hypothetical protein
MNGLASLIAVLGSGYAGYVKGNQMEEDRAVQKARDAREQERYEFDKRQRDKQEKLDRDLGLSQEDQQIGATTNTGATYTDESLIGADNRENRRNAEQIGMAAPAPIATTGFTANGQQYADRGAAQTAMLGVNSRSAKMERAAQVYGAAGQVDKQMQFMKFAEDARNEGADKLLAAIQSTAPGVDALKKAPGGIVAGTVGQESADIFNKTGGKWKVSPDTKVEYYLEKDAAGRDVVNARVLGKDGSPVVDNVKGAQLMLADMKTRLENEKNNMTVFQKGQEITEAGRHNKAAEATAARSAEASIISANASAQNAATHAESLKMQQDQFKRQSLEGQVDQLERVTGPMKPEERKVLALQLAGLGKDNQAYSKFVDGIVTEGVKAGTVKPEDATKVRDKLLQSKAVADQEAIIASDLASSANDPASYVEKYQKALKITPAARLQEMGFKPPAQPKARPAARVGVNTANAAPANDAVDVSGDVVLASLRQQMAGLNPNDPKNADKVMAIGNARNARIGQLQQQYGSMTKLVGV